MIRSFAIFFAPNIDLGPGWGGVGGRGWKQVESKTSSFFRHSQKK